MYSRRVKSTHWFIVFLFMVLLMCMSPSMLSPVVTIIHTSYKDDKNLRINFINYTKKAVKAGIQVQSIKKAFLPPDIVAPPNPPKNILNKSSGVMSATYIKKTEVIHTIIVIRLCLVFSYIFFSSFCLFRQQERSRQIELKFY